VECSEWLLEGPHQQQVSIGFPWWYLALKLIWDTSPFLNSSPSLPQILSYLSKYIRKRVKNPELSLTHQNILQLCLKEQTREMYVTNLNKARVGTPQQKRHGKHSLTWEILWALIPLKRKLIRLIAQVLEVHIRQSLRYANEIICRWLTASICFCCSSM
jgi:hypothetical protein